MPELDDHELLAEFAGTHSEAAFAALVARHLNLVYSTALRFTGNSHHAEEITQAVFIILAQKAGKLSARVVLSGWLYQVARFTTANFLKGEIRRQHREQEAYMQTILNESDAQTWQQIAPLLDEAMGRLGETDRNAIVLRFFENKTAAEAASQLNLSEAAAHKRMNRALEKLRKFFTKRGVSSTTAIIAVAISANSVQAAPVALVKTISVVAAAKGAAAATSTLTLVKGALKLMAWTKAKMAVGVSMTVLLAGGAVAFALTSKPNVEQIAPPTGNHVGTTFFSMLEKAPVVVKAVFEKEIFMNNVPAAARKQTFTFSSDGDDYRLSTDGITAGKFGGVSWQTQNGYLTLFDPKINKIEGGSGGILELGSVTRMTVDLFLSLGIQDMLPGTAVWETVNTRFTAKTRDGKNLVVETLLTNGVPGIAYQLNDAGQRFKKVEFRYSSGFYGGQVPIEFTAYWMKPNGVSDDQKIYIRVKTLEISDDQLDKSLLNPANMNGRATAIIYSNNIAYERIPKGNLRRILTQEEELKNIKAMQKAGH